MSEPGFEVASAYVRVAPDASDFAAALDEQVGGLTLSVGVTPNAADFAAALDETLGGLSVSVSVTPDASDFAASLEEQLGGLSVTATVTPDAADFEASLLEQAGGITVPVTVTAEAAGVSDLGDSVSEQAGTIALPVTPVPETAGFEAALGEQVGDLSVPVTVYPDTTADDFQSQLDDRVGTPVVGVDLQATAANIAEHIADSLTGAIPVPVVPNMADFADAVAEQTAGLTVTAQVIPDISGDSLSLPVTPDMTDFDGAVQEEAGGIAAAVQVVPSPESLNAFPARVEEETAGITVPVTVTPVVPADFGAQVSEQAGTQSAGVSLETGETAEDLASVTQAEQSAAAGASGLAEQYEALQAQFAGMGSELDYVTGRFTALSPGIAASAEETDALSGTLSSLQAQFAAVGEYITSFGSETDKWGGSITESAGEVSLLSGMLAELQGNLAAADDAVTSWVASSAAARDAAAGAASGVDVLASSADGLSASMSGADGAAQEAAAGTSALSGQYEALRAQLTAVAGGMDNLNARYNYLSQRTAASSEDIASAGADLDTLGTQYAYVSSAVGSLGSEMTAAGADAAASGEQLATVSSLMTQLQENVDTTEGAFEAWSGRITGAAVQASQGVDVLTDSTSELSDAAPVASDAASGLSGVLGTLGERLGYMAVDPFMWMMAAPMVIEGVTAAIKGLNDTSVSYIQELEQEDNATGYNIAGYQKLIGQLTSAAAGYEKVAAAAGDNVRSGAGLQEEYAQLSQAQQQQVTDLGNLTGHLDDLQGTYGLTQLQAESLASAAGVQATQLQGSGSAADAAMAKIQAYATSNETASGAVAALTQDQEVFSSSAFTATARVSDMDNAFTTLAGNFISVQTAQLNVTGGFDGLEAASTAAGASMKGTNLQSVGLQQSFYAQASAIEQAANAMVQNGDSAQTVTGYINTQIGTLSKYEGGSKNATTAVQGLKNWEDSLTGSLQTQGSYLSGTLSNDLDNAILKYSGTQTAVNNYANALVDFGKNSPQAKNAQDLLTDSIVKGGNAAGESTSQIATMISTMEKIPLKEAIQIVLNAEGQYSVSGTAVAPVAVNSGLTNVPGTNLGPVVAGHAGGGLVTGGSGRARADDIPAMLSHGEYVVSAQAVGRYGTGFLDSVNAQHFASGGSVSGSYSGDAAGLGSFLAGNYNSTNSMLIQAVENAMAGAIASAQSTGGSAKAPVIVNFNGTQFPTAEQKQALMTELSALVGVS